jgi:Iron-containing redox enzyme
VSTASTRLRRKLALAEPAFGTPGGLLLEHPRVRELFPVYLATGAYLTLVMVPLMEAALERARALAASDPVAAGLAAYLERHIPEEMHGDEPGGAALDDLAALGIDVDALRSGPVSPRLAELIGNQYVWIWHHHPVAILGVISLEAYHPEVAYIEQLMQRTGLPRDGFRQLLLHAELDVEHAAELEQVLDSLPLQPEHEQAIALSALQAMALLTAAWMDVLDNQPVASTASVLVHEAGEGRASD